MFLDEAHRRYFHSPRIFLDSRGRVSLSHARFDLSKRASRTTRKLLIAGQLKLDRADHERDSPGVCFPGRFLEEMELELLSFEKSYFLIHA